MKPTLESLTTQERLNLANAARQAAMGIALIWDALTEIGDRHGCEWEPEGERMSCSDYANELAGCVLYPNEAMELTEEDVLVNFLDPEDWQEGE